MGLGSKIKEALGSDKGHRSSPSQSRRTAPGAYPDSVADIPRTASTNTKARTWDATDTYAKEKQQQQTAAATTNTTTTADNPRTSDNASDEYTFSPVSDKDNLAKTNDESELIAPSPDSRIAGNPTTNNAAFAKDAKSQQHPYWGNIGKADARDDARGLNGRAPVSPFDDHSQAAYIDVAGVPVSGNSLGRNGTINNGEDSRMGHHADARGYDDDERYGSPILASVNHGQPRLAADDDEARVASMAATQLSHGSEYNGSQAQGPVGLGYPSAIPDRTNSRHDRAGYGARYDDRDDYGTRQGMTGSPGPMPSNARGTFGSPQGINDVHGAGNGYAVGGRAVDQFAGKDRGQSGSTGSSANGNNSAGASKAGSSGDHYGPGHSGARVLHRCEHCGNDNDISKYFSKDVVYRLS